MDGFSDTPMFFGDINPDEALTVDELLQKIKAENDSISSIEESIAEDLEYAEFVKAESQPYNQEISEIELAIAKLMARKRELSLSKSDLGYKYREAVNGTYAKKSQISSKEKYVGELKALLHKQSMEMEKVALLDKKGDELQAKAETFPWFPFIKGYQLDGAKQMAIMKKAINADEMGLGKSLQALAAADLVGAKRILIVSKIDIVQNFANEVAKWSPHRKTVFCLPGYKRSFQKHYLQNVLPYIKDQGFVVLLNFETWWSDPEVIQLLIELQFDTVIFDEAHHMKEKNGKTSIGIRKLIQATNMCVKCSHNRVSYEHGNTHRCVKCGHLQDRNDCKSVANVWPMTGSPILNRPDEIWPLLNCIDPNTFADHRTFLNRYCAQSSYYNLRGNRATRWVFKHGGSNKLLRQIGPQLIRRTKDQSGIEIPAQSVVIKTVEMDPEKYPRQRKAYDELLEYFGAMFNDEDESFVIASTGATIIGRLRQITSFPAGIKIHETDPDTGVKKLVWQCDVRESVKVDACIEDVIEAFGRGERVVVFSKHVATIEEIKRRLDLWDEGERAIRSAVYYGKTDLATRERIKKDFDVSRTDPKDAYWDVVICQNEAASQGLNFNGAQHMVIVERLWGPKLEEQQLARTARMGQTKKTTVTIIEVADSIDKSIAELLYTKREQVDEFEESSDMVQKLIQRLFKKANETKIQGM